MTSNSIFDALVSRLDLETALSMSQCSKGLHVRVCQSLDDIVKNDNQNPLVRLFKVANGPGATIEKLKGFKDEIKIEKQIFKNLLLNDIATNDFGLQDIYIKYLFHEVDDVYAMDTHVSNLVNVFLDGFYAPNADIVINMKKYIFLLRVLGAFVRWVISSGHLDDWKKMQYFRSHHMWHVVEARLAYFKRCLFSLPAECGPVIAMFNSAVKFNEKYILAVVNMISGCSNYTLHIGPKGGFYMVDMKGKRTYL